MIKNSLHTYLIDQGYEHAIAGWFKSLHFEMDSNEEKLHIIFPHTFFEIWFKQVWQNTFEVHIKNALNINSIHYSTKNIQTKEKNLTELIHIHSNAIPNHIQDTNINFKNTFSNFLYNNKYTYIIQHTKFLCENQTHSSCLTLLHGPSGTGKTHILHAMAHYLPQHMSYTYYDTPEQLSERINTKIITSPTHYIFIDNMHTIKEKAQDNFTQILDIYKQKKIQCIIAGTDSPHLWLLKSTLRSRFSDAIWLVLPLPDLDIRLQYINKWCQKYALYLQKEHCILIAQTCQTIRKLSGILQQIKSQEQFLTHKLNTIDVENILKNNEITTLTPQDIITQVAYYFTMQTKDILQEKRDPKRVKARYIAMLLCRELLGHSYPSIGRSFGGKDHSTVMYGIRKIKQLQQVNKDIDNDVQQLTKQCLKKNI